MTTKMNDVSHADGTQNFENDPHRARLRRLAWLLDSSIRLPGGYKIGIDGIIGLIPGIGDTVGAALSSYIIISAARMGIPVIVLIRMGLNLLLEMTIGVIPLIGDIFDFVFKANERNVRLIEAHLDQPDSTRTKSQWTVVAVVISLLLLIGFALAVTVSLLNLLWSALAV